MSDTAYVKVETRYEGIYAISYLNGRPDSWIIEWNSKERGVQYYLHTDFVWRKFPESGKAEHLKTLRWPSKRSAKHSLWRMKRCPPNYSGRVRSVTDMERGLDFVVHAGWGRVYRCL